MAYTWTNKTKTGGVGLTGKIVQKGKDDFPLMYASDLDWANVEVESGVNLNTTDDLLDYIKGGNGTINGRIDELELSNAGYEIRCDKSVCYVGDTVGQGYQNQKLPVSIYKNGTLLSWTNAYTEGITFDSNNFTKPSGGNDLIHWSTSDCYLQGEANKIGTYVFNFKKGDVNIASFMLTVLMKPLESYHTTIYISSQTKPTTPTGGSYNFSTKAFTAPSGWYTSITGLTGTIWFSSGTVFSDSNTSPVWSEPCMYITSETVLKDDEHRVREVAVYKVACGPYTYGNTQYQETVPPKPTTQNLYTFNADSTLDSFTPPSGWHKEPEAAIAAYKNSLTNSAEDQIKKQNYRIWKTYNSYSITVTDGVLVTSTYAESGWSQPVRYLNIDKILEDARTQSEQIAQTALQNAYNDLDLAEDLETVVDAINAVFAWRIVGDASNNNPLSNISDKYVELVDDADTSSAQHQLFTRFSGYRKQNGNYEGTLETMNNTTNLCVSGYQMKALKFDSIYYDGQEYLNKWVAFIPTTTEIRTQISDLNEDLGELSTAVNAMNPHEIRLQVSKGFKKDVTWTEVDVTEWKSARTEIDGHSDDEEYDVNYGDTIRHSQKLDGQGNWSYMQVPSITDDCISALPIDPYDINHLGGFRYGHYYSVHYGSNSAGDPNAGYKYFRCDYPVSTGFLNILADKVNLGVADTQGGKATLQLKVKDGNGTASVVANQIVLDGETIADAIAAKSLNINNTTYLCKDGDVYFGVPTTQSINPDASDKTNLNTGNRSSRFNKDGSGQLCGGNISWNNNGVLCVKQANIGEATANWYIKTLGLSDSIVNNNSQSELYGTPVIYGRDTSTNDELFITPQYMFSCNSAHETDRNYDYWRIQRDGSARFAKGNITFNNDGSATLGNASGAHVEISSAGAVSLHGVDVNISSANSTTIASGIIGSEEATSILLNGTNNTIGITGKLNTQDLSVGNGACFFKGTDNNSAETNHGVSYPAHSIGAGHLANGNIWWDKDGNLHAKGLMTNRCEYVPGNSNQTVVLDGNNLHSVTLAPTVHRMVVLPTYSDFVDHGSGWTVNGYQQDGTTINIKAEPYDGCSNWSMLKEDSWSNPGNYASTADLFKHCILICADPATLCTGAGDNLPIHSWKGEDPSLSKTVTFANSANVYNNGEWYTPSGNPSYEKEFKYPYRDGRFCARGSYSRFILLLPGQQLTLTSSIQKITVNDTEKSYLVWNVENAADFQCIRTYMIDNINDTVVNGADFDKNDTSMQPYISQFGIGDGLLSYKYMSYDCYAKGDSVRDIERSIFVQINYANSVYDEDNDEMRITIPSWQTAILQNNSRYDDDISNTVNWSIPNN